MHAEVSLNIESVNDAVNKALPLDVDQQVVELLHYHIFFTRNRAQSESDCFYVGKLLRLKMENCNGPDNKL